MTEEQIFNEIEDRQRRSTNIIVSNVPESQADTPEEKNKDDLNSVMKLITDTVSTNEIVKCFRIGKPMQSKIRLLKVVFLTAEHAQTVLRNYKSSRNNVYVNRDLTQLHQNKAYSVRKEFKDRITKGETNIKLKYYNGGT